MFEELKYLQCGFNEHSNIKLTREIKSIKKFTFPNIFVIKKQKECHTNLFRKKASLHATLLLYENTTSLTS